MFNKSNVKLLGKTTHITSLRHETGSLPSQQKSICKLFMVIRRVRAPAFSAITKRLNRAVNLKETHLSTSQPSPQNRTSTHLQLGHTVMSCLTGMTPQPEFQTRALCPTQTPLQSEHGATNTIHCSGALPLPMVLLTCKSFMSHFHLSLHNTQNILGAFTTQRL